MPVAQHYNMEYGDHQLTANELLVLTAFREIVREQVREDPDGEGLAVPLHKLMLWLMSDRPSQGGDPPPVTDTDIENWSQEQKDQYVLAMQAWSDATDFRDWTPNPGVDSGVWTVVWGAIDINAGFSQGGEFQGLLVAEYTIAQIMARTGVSRSEAIALNQEASNEIALNLANEIILSPGKIPTLVSFGAVDAGAAASKALDGDYAGWAGVAFFPLLGDDDAGERFIREWLLEHRQVVGTAGFAPGDPARDDPTNHVTFKHIEGTYDLVAFLHAGIESAFNAGFADPIDAVGALFNQLLGSGQQLSPGSTLLEDISQFFDDYYGLSLQESFSVGDSSIFGVTGAFSAKNYVVGTADNDDGDRPIILVENTASLDFEWIVNAGPGDDVIVHHHSNAGSLIDGHEGKDSVEYRTSFPSYVPLYLQFGVAEGAVGDFDYRLEVARGDGGVIDLLYDIEVLKVSHFLKLHLEETLPEDLGLEIEYLQADDDAPISEADFSSTDLDLIVELSSIDGQTIRVAGDSDASIKLSNANLIRTGSGTM